jgi:hypothetical protein
MRTLPLAQAQAPSAPVQDRATPRPADNAQGPSRPIAARATGSLDSAPGLRLLVCGNRDWTCLDTIASWLRPFRKRGPVTVIHGAARGADFLAGEAAKALGFAVEEYPADWDQFGRRAGPIRNEAMAAQNITRGLAFGSLYRGSRLTGTGDMVVRLLDRGLLVTVVPCAGVLP